MLTRLLIEKIVVLLAITSSIFIVFISIKKNAQKSNILAHEQLKLTDNFPQVEKILLEVNTETIIFLNGLPHDMNKLEKQHFIEKVTKLTHAFFLSLHTKNDVEQIRATETLKDKMREMQDEVQNKI